MCKMVHLKKNRFFKSCPVCFDILKLINKTVKWPITAIWGFCLYVCMIFLYD